MLNARRHPEDGRRSSAAREIEGEQVRTALNERAKMLDSDGWAVETRGLAIYLVVYTPRGANRGAYSFLRPGFGQNPLMILPIGCCLVAADRRVLFNRCVDLS